MQFGFNGMAYSTFWFFRGDTPMLDQWIPADVCLFLAIAAYYNVHRKAAKVTEEEYKIKLAEFDKENEKKENNALMSNFFTWDAKQFKIKNKRF
jgi:hypothetical protein